MPNMPTNLPTYIYSVCILALKSKFLHHLMMYNESLGLASYSELFFFKFKLINSLKLGSKNTT